MLLSHRLHVLFTVTAGSLQREAGALTLPGRSLYSQGIRVERGCGRAAEGEGTCTMAVTASWDLNP